MNVGWQVPVIVVAIVGVMLYLMNRRTNDPATDPEREPPEPLSGPELVDQIQRTLGIGILVDTVGSDEPVTIHATLVYGRFTTPVAVTADTEALAWQELAKAAIAWRNSDYQNVPMWWGGGV